MKALINHCFLLKIILVSAGLLGLLLIASCRKDFEYRESEGRLEFSKDTVFLDTVFTNTSSSTYSLKVYNRTGDDIIIPNVTLENGVNSNYRLNVDGVAGKVFEDVTIMAKDSIFIFIETTFNIDQINQNEFLYTDMLQFISSTATQEVPLVTLIKDAVFLFPSELADGSKETIVIGQDENGNDIRVEGFVLEDDQLNFSNEKPYVIYGYAAVAESRILEINAGARIHFHQNSGLIIGEGASLRINGELSEDAELLENEVILEGDRLEPEFSEIPGQWGTVWITEGSLDHQINYCTIRNATIGLLVEGRTGSDPLLGISNSQIYNSTGVNLWGITTSIEAENLVLGNAGEASLLCETGGNYNFIHCTISNYWSNGFRTGSALQISNFDNSTEADLQQARFTNCIIDGNISREISLRSNGSNSFNFNFSHCIIKFMDSAGIFENDPLYDFENELYYSNIILNGEAEFLNTARNDFRIAPPSQAIDTAQLQAAQIVPLDLLGNDRLENPDLGAYEFTPEE